MTSSLELWERHSRMWGHFGPPLRPTIQDIELFERLIADHCRDTDRSAVGAVLLGVTPEIAMMKWPSNTELLAIDENIGMIRNVWPGSMAPGGKAACAGWAAMPVTDGTCDVVVGDGCFCLLPHFPDGYSALFREIRRVLKPSGVFAARAFIRPLAAERVSDVFEDLWEGGIGNFHVFKWRLAMALHSDIRKGVPRAEVWNAWHKAIPDPAILAAELNWPLEAISTIDNFRDIDACLTFPTLEELREVFSSYFVETDCFFPDYELGDRCPIISLEIK